MPYGSTSRVERHHPQHSARRRPWRWIFAFALLVVAGGALYWLLAGPSRREPQVGEGFLGDRVVSWINTRTVLVEAVSGDVRPARLDVLTGRSRALPIEDVLLHLGGSRRAIGADKSGAMLAIDLATGVIGRAPGSDAGVARCGAASPDGRLIVARELAEGAPTDGWALFTGKGRRVARIVPDGVGSPGGDPSWSAASNAVAVPLEPGDADEATIVVAWAPSWRPVQVRVKGYEGGPVVFDASGARLVYARTGSDGGTIEWAGRTTGLPDASVSVPGLGGLVGRDASGRVVAYVGRIAGGTKGRLWLASGPPSGPDALGASSGGGRVPRVDAIPLPLPVESAVLDPSGNRALVICVAPGDRRVFYLADLGRLVARRIPASR